MSETDSIFDLLAPILAGEEASFAEACRRRGLRPAQALAKMVDDGSDCLHERAASPGRSRASPLQRYERLQHADHLALDAELTGARFRAVRTMNDLAGPKEMDVDTTAGRMRSLEIVRRACVSLMRLHLPTCNMAPPREAPRLQQAARVSHVGHPVNDIIKDSRPLSQELLIPSMRFTSESHRSARGNQSQVLTRRPTEGHTTLTTGVPPSKAEGMRRTASQQPSESQCRASPPPEVCVPPPHVRKKLVADLMDEGVPRIAIARAFQDLRATRRFHRSLDGALRKRPP